MVGSYRAVDHLNLDVAPGQMLALLGKTGCGKSTIFNMIAGLTEPTAGTVRVNGKNPFADFYAFLRQDGHRVSGRSSFAVAHRDPERAARS